MSMLCTICAQCGRLTLWPAGGRMPHAPAPESGLLCPDCFGAMVRLAYWRDLAGLSAGERATGGRPLAAATGTEAAQSPQREETEDMPPIGPTQPPPRYDRPDGRPGVFATYGYAARVAVAWLLLTLGGLAALAIALRLLWALGGLLASALGGGR